MAASSIYTATTGRTRRVTFDLDEGPIEGSVSQYVLKVLPNDILAVLRGVAYEELNAQIDADNPPSQILVDGRAVGARNIFEARRKVSMRFADTRLLLTAVQEAYAQLVRVTRIESPPKNSIVARQNFHLYLNGKPLGRMPTALSKITPGVLDQNSVLRVVGPLVPYGRKLYWNPIGKARKMVFAGASRIAVAGDTSEAAKPILGTKYAPRFKPFKAKTLRRLANRGGLGAEKAARLRALQAAGAGYVEGTHQIVKRILRGIPLFKSLHIADGWVAYPPAKSWGKSSRDNRVPSVSVQLARKGRVRLINI
jgi:hypothetical protein